MGPVFMDLGRLPSRTHRFAFMRNYVRYRASGENFSRNASQELFNLTGDVIC